MEMELFTHECRWSLEHISHESRLELLHILAGLIDDNLGSVTFPEDFDVVLLVGVPLLEVILGSLVWFAIHLPWQVDWTVVGESALVVCNVGVVSPVSSVLLVGPRCCLGQGKHG